MQTTAAGQQSRRASLEQTAVDNIPALRAFARNFSKDPSYIDDLVQETLTKSIAKMHQFTPGTSMKSWMFTIMRNTFNTNSRKSVRQAPGAIDCVAGMPSVDPRQEWHMRGRELAAALDRLPTPHRKVLLLVGVQGASYKETAECCGCAMGTVKSRLYRARLRLSIELHEESISSILHSDPDYMNHETSINQERQ